MTRPTVFLSHSKADKSIIVRVADALRECRVNSWYDEWEIPPGASFRRKIFQDGIPNCDSFFVYLTQSSLKSYWVEKELDAIFIEESRNKNVNIITFVDSEETISKLPADIAALNCPILHQDNFESATRKLLTSVYDALLSKIQKTKDLESENIRLKLEMEIQELKAKIDELSSDPKSRAPDLFEQLCKYTFNIEDKTITAVDVLKYAKPELANGTNNYRFIKAIKKGVGQEMPEDWRIQELFGENLTFNNLIWPLIARSVIDIQRPTDEMQQHYYLSERGTELCLYIEENAL